MLVLVVLSITSFASLGDQLVQKLDLQRGLHADSYLTFEIDGQQVIYVLQENTTAITRGVAVLMADHGAPLGLASLAEQLNNLGWVTILLSAPNIDFFMPTKQGPDLEDSNSEQKAEVTPDILDQQGDDSNISVPIQIPDQDINKSAISTIEDEVFDQYEQQIVALLQASFEKSQEYPGFFLVISKGTSAAWLSKVYAEKKLEQPDAFVAMGPYWPDRKRNQLLPNLIANTPMPVLDLYNASDNKWARTTVVHRAVAATKSLKLHYRQRELFGHNTHLQKGNNLSKEIYGWISHMGW